MPQFPLAARVVEIIADRGESCTPRYQCGSGCLVAGRTVLTAAHVVAGAVSVLVRGPDKVPHQAALDPAFAGDADGPGPDLALVEIIGDAVDVPALGLAAVNRDSPAGDPVERCHVIGYPAFMERVAADGDRFRETADAVGQVPVMSGLAAGLLSVQVSSSPEPLPSARVALGDSPWSGISGGPVVADGLLLGVVTEHAPRAGSSAITATPLTALEVDPNHPGWGPGVVNPGAWLARLGAVGAGTPKLLPAASRRGRPAYWATVQEIRKRTGTLTGRQAELAAIALFAAGDEGYRWLMGEAWTGKTALLAEAVTTLPGDVDVVCYFLSRREADADSSRFLAAVVPQLANLLDEDSPAADLYQYRALWQRAAERADTDGRHLVLVVDALDEDLRPPGLPSVAALLPAGAGGHAQVLVSSRPNPELPADIPAGHPLRRARPVPVQPFSGARELAVLARQEIDDLLRRDDDGLVADVLGLLTAAAGPLTVRDLATMTTVATPSAALTRRIRKLIITSAARSLQIFGPAGSDRHQFAHESLLAYAQADNDLNDPVFRRRLHEWADSWRTVGWPTPAGGEKGTPQYLLDTYPATLTQDPRQLSRLTTDIGWVEAAIASVGVDLVLANLQRSAAANPNTTAVEAVLAVVTGQAHNLRPSQPLDQPGYILRQVCLQAYELSEGQLAEELRGRLESRHGSEPIPLWTTRSAGSILPIALGHHGNHVHALGVLPDARIVTGGGDQVLIWNPDTPGSGPSVLCRPGGTVWTLAVLPDGRVVTSGSGGRVLVWDPDAPGAAPSDLGAHEGGVDGMAVLPDGRVVTSGSGGRVLVWDPDAPGAAPSDLGAHEGGVERVAVLPDGRIVIGGPDGQVLVRDSTEDSGPTELGRHNGRVMAVAVLPDGRFITGGDDNRILVWDPTAPGAAPVELGRHDAWVRAAAVMPGGRVVTAANDYRVLIWDLAAPGTDPTEIGRTDAPAPVIAVLPDGRVITGEADGQMLIWDPAEPGLSTAKLEQHQTRTASVRTVALLPDRRIVTGGDDGQVLVWDLPAPNLAFFELGRHDSSVNTLAMLPDGRVVTGGGDGQVLIWDPAAPNVGSSDLGRHSSYVFSLAVLQDGRVVTTGYDDRILAWDPAKPGTGPAEQGRFTGGVAEVKVLPDGRVVTGGADGRVLVWDPAKPGADPTELGRYDASALKVAALPDGRVVTGGTDGRVLIWDPAKPGTDPIELGRHDRWVVAMAVLADGRLVTGGDDRRVLVWNPARSSSSVTQLNCSVGALATSQAVPDLVVAHKGDGFSFWSVTADHHETLPGG